MNRRFASVTTWLVVFGVFASQACAHYLWVTIDTKSGEHGTTNIYFEGGPGAGDGQYNDPFVERGKTWIRTVGQSKPKLLKVADTEEGNKRWLSGELTSAGPRSIDSYGKWGVYRYGETDVLLHYYARNLDVKDHDDLHELARAEQQALDIVPHDEEGDVQLKVVWQGKPAEGRTVAIRGPGGFKESLKTDKSGHVRFTPKAEGRYTFRTNVYEKGKSGEFDGKEYQEVRHHATLLMKLPLGS
jgi:hypothetical protein